MVREASEREIRALEGRLTDEYVQEERLCLLCEMYVRDEITTEQLADYAECVLKGEQPEGLMPDPELYNFQWR